MTHCFTLTFLFCYIYIRFNDQMGVEKKMLPQYDDPVADEVDSNILTMIFFCKSTFINFLDSLILFYVTGVDS